MISFGHRCPTSGPPAIAPRCGTWSPGVLHTSLSVRWPIARGGSLGSGDRRGRGFIRAHRRRRRGQGLRSQRGLGGMHRATDSAPTARVSVRCGSPPKTGLTTGPKSKIILLGMVYDPASRRVLGVQGVSDEGEVAKRIDVAAQLILRRGDHRGFHRSRTRLCPAVRAGPRPVDRPRLRGSERTRRDRSRVSADGSVDGDGARCQG